MFANKLSLQSRLRSKKCWMKSKHAGNGISDSITFLQCVFNSTGNFRYYRMIWCFCSSFVLIRHWCHQLEKKVCKSMWWRSILLKSQWSHLYALISKTWAHLTHVIFNCVFKPCQTRLEFSQWMFPQWLSSDLFHSEIKSVVE